MNKGYHSIVWNANQYSSGIYFVRMVTGSYVTSNKVVLIK